MAGKILPRIGTIAFVSVAITICVMQMRQAPRSDAVATPIPAAVAADPLRTELFRCQSIGQAGASDTACLQAWAENRRRFLSTGGRSAAGLPSAPAAADVPSPKVADPGNAVTILSGRGGY